MDVAIAVRNGLHVSPAVLLMYLDRSVEEASVAQIDEPLHV